MQKGLPHLVQMQKKYGMEDLVTLPVQLDALDETNLKELVAKALKSKGVTVPSLILNEEQDVWQKKLRFDSYPCVYVFNREGKWVQFRSQDPKYNKIDTMLEDIDKLVGALLAKKK